MAPTSTTEKTVAIVGAGLVGSLQACFLARRGYNVHLYEMRSDIRRQEIVIGRSINLALSCRGREALRHVGLEDEVISNGIKMFGRMIHNVNGKRRPIYYGRKDQYIMSVDRRRLNEILLTAAEKYSNVQIHFEHKLFSCDLDNKELVFERPTGEKVRATADLIIGTDGAFSALRNHIMKSTRMDYSQEYIPHGYIELRIPPTEDNKFAMETNYLHIWPREAYMLIALPNVKDNSFVLTLFMPFSMYESLTTDSKVQAFFEEKFPDALRLIGRQSLVETFRRLTPLPLVSVKCRPYHIGDRVVLLGDAAHAMVPFYGQGLNCGFEDLLVFDDLMTKHNNNLALVLPAYTEYRSLDVPKMNDLAMYNYVEMRSHVNSKKFLLRKYLDNFLYWLLPRTWIPLYTMVAFTRTRYHECLARRQWQDKIINRAVWSTAIAALVAASYTILHTFTASSVWTAFTNSFGPILAVIRSFGGHVTNSTQHEL
jgi:kynurenine 3-monooxygenase